MAFQEDVIAVGIARFQIIDDAQACRLAAADDVDSGGGGESGILLEGAETNALGCTNEDGNQVGDGFEMRVGLTYEGKCNHFEQ